MAGESNADPERGPHPRISCAALGGEQKQCAGEGKHRPCVKQGAQLDGQAHAALRQIQTERRKHSQTSNSAGSHGERVAVRQRREAEVVGVGKQRSADQPQRIEHAQRRLEQSGIGFEQITLH